MLYEVLINLAYLAGFIPLTLFLLGKGRNSVELKNIEPYLWFLTFANLYELIGTKLFQIHTNIWFRVYVLLDFIIVGYFFYRLLKQKFTWIFIVFALVFLISFIYLTSLWYEMNSYKGDSYLTVIETVFVFTCSILWFREIFLNLEVEHLTRNPSIYFVAGIIFYFSGTLFFFLISSYLTNGDEINHQYRIINIVFTLLLRILLTIGVWKGQKKLVSYSG